MIKISDGEFARGTVGAAAGLTAGAGIGAYAGWKTGGGIFGKFKGIKAGGIIGGITGAVGLGMLNAFGGGRKRVQQNFVPHEKIGSAQKQVMYAMHHVPLDIGANKLFDKATDAIGTAVASRIEPGIKRKVAIGLSMVPGYIAKPYADLTTKAISNKMYANLIGKKMSFKKAFRLASKMEKRKSDFHGLVNFLEDINSGVSRFNTHQPSLNAQNHLDTVLKTLSYNMHSANAVRMI